LVLIGTKIIKEAKKEPSANVGGSFHIFKSEILLAVNKRVVAIAR